MPHPYLYLMAAGGHRALNACARPCPSRDFSCKSAPQAYSRGFSNNTHTLMGPIGMTETLMFSITAGKQALES